MPYTPSISNYKPFYFQTTSDATAWDTRDYGLVVQEQPFPDNYEVKEPYKNDWFDEDGDDEYNAVMHRKAFEITIKLYIKAYPITGSGAKTAIQNLNDLRDSFRAKLIPGEFKIWDSWQGKGFQGVRFVKDNVEMRDVTDEEAWMIFSVTLKVNDPSTSVSYNSTNNTITATV